MVYLFEAGGMKTKEYRNGAKALASIKNGRLGKSSNPPAADFVEREPSVLNGWQPGTKRTPQCPVNKHLYVGMAQGAQHEDAENPEDDNSFRPWRLRGGRFDE